MPSFEKISYQEFNALLKQGRADLIVDNMGAIKAAQQGLTNPRGNVLAFFLAWVLLIAGVIFAFVKAWWFGIAGLVCFGVLSNLSQKIRNEALLKACLSDESIYDVCVRNNLVYVRVYPGSYSQNEVNENSEKSSKDEELDSSNDKLENKSILNATSSQQKDIQVSTYKDDEDGEENVDQDVNENIDQYVDAVTEKLFASREAKAMDELQRLPAVKRAMGNYIGNCFAVGVGWEACANRLLSILDDNKGRPMRIIEQIASESSYVESFTTIDEVEDYEGYNKYSPEETDYHYFFDEKFKELSLLFVDEGLLETDIERQVAAIKIVHLATCCADPDLESSSYCNSIAYKILDITKEKWQSSGIERNEQGHAVFVDYAPPYTVELYDDFGISKFKALKKSFQILGITDEDDRAERISDAFDEAVIYAKREIAPRIHKAFS